MVSIYGADMVPTRNIWDFSGPDMRAKITLRTVAATRPGTKIYDTEVKGFVLVVTPVGTKSYAVEYREGRGRGAPNRRLTNGKHGSPWTLDAARCRAQI